MKKTDSNRNVIISFILIVVIIGIAVFLFTNRNRLFGDGNGEEYNGEILYDTFDTRKISYSFPDEFQDRSLISRNGSINGVYEEMVYENGNRVLDQCAVNLGIVKNYTGAESLARGIANYHNTNYESVTINGIDWYSIQYDRAVYTYAYMTDYKGKILLYTYDVYRSDCTKYNEEIIESIRID